MSLTVTCLTPPELFRAAALRFQPGRRHRMNVEFRNEDGARVHDSIILDCQWTEDAVSMVLILEQGQRVHVDIPDTAPGSARAAVVVAPTTLSIPLLVRGVERWLMWQSSSDEWNSGTGPFDHLAPLRRQPLAWRQTLAQHAENREWALVLSHMRDALRPLHGDTLVCTAAVMFDVNGTVP